jgi:Spy/CpxP family protein refolding chaperone
MNKKTLAVVVGFLVLAVAAMAQEGRRNQTFTERYGAQLNLTDAQKKTIDELDQKFQKDNAAFMETYQKTMAEYRGAREANDQAKLDALKPKVDEQRAEMTKLRTAHEENIAKSFTADQKAAWTKIKEEREARMKERAAQQQH